MYIGWDAGTHDDDAADPSRHVLLAAGRLMRILVVEDERKIATLISRALQRAGFAVDVVADGEATLWRAHVTAYDAILLDRMLPGIDGIEVCRRLRDERVATPVLMLTAMGEVPDRVQGLDAGADDYLAKPFAVEELVARVRALARRGPTMHPPVLEVGDLRLDGARHRVWRGDDLIALTPRKFASRCAGCCWSVARSSSCSPRRRATWSPPVRCVP